MVDKFDFYDLLSVVIPGAILVVWVPTCWPEILTIAHPRLPEGFIVILLLALSIVTGHAAQSIASLLEPLHDWTFKGKVARLLMAKKLRLVPFDLVERVRERVLAQVGRPISDDEIFLYAQERARGLPHSRSERFQAIYAYNRNLIVVLIIMILNFIPSMFVGGVQAWPYQPAVLAVLVAFLFLQWFRTRRRNEYYAREVLVACESSFDLVR